MPSRRALGQQTTAIRQGYAACSDGIAATSFAPPMVVEIAPNRSRLTAVAISTIGRAIGRGDGRVPSRAASHGGVAG